MRAARPTAAPGTPALRACGLAPGPYAHPSAAATHDKRRLVRRSDANTFEPTAYSSTHRRTADPILRLCTPATSQGAPPAALRTVQTSSHPRPYANICSMAKDDWPRKDLKPGDPVGDTAGDLATPDLHRALSQGQHCWVDVGENWVPALLISRKTADGWDGLIACQDPYQQGPILQFRCISSKRLRPSTNDSGPATVARGSG